MQPTHRCLHTQSGSAHGPWQHRCKHAGVKGLALVSGAGLAVHCMAADSQNITEKVKNILCCLLFCYSAAYVALSSDPLVNDRICHHM